MIEFVTSIFDHGMVLPGESGGSSSSLKSYGEPYDETSETRFHG